MRHQSTRKLAAATAALGLAFAHIVLAPNTFGGDEPGLLGRLFRAGNGNANNPASAPASNPGSSSSPSSGPAMPMPTTPAATPPAPEFSTGRPALSTPAPSLSGNSVAPRITPRPRVNKGLTDADPLVTRVSIGRSDNGSQFAMLLEVFADGTVIDTEGVHKVGPDVLKPVVEAVTSGELAKLKGYCGGPAGDFIENVHVVVYERSMGRLRANAFSYSGNPQGCDHAVHHLQKTLDTLQTKLAPAGSAPVAATSPTLAPAMPLTTTR